MVVSNNFYGATALAMLFPVLMLSVYITHRDPWMWVRGAAIGTLAYGLTAFWLTPSYLRLTLLNMQYVSKPGHLWSKLLLLALAIAFVLLATRFAKGKKELAYLVFVSGATALFITNVVGNHYWDFRVIGEPGRLFPELDLVMTLFAVEMLRRLWSAPVLWRRALAIGIAGICLSTSYQYVRQSRAFFVADPDPTQRVEFRMQDWMAKNMPQSRAFTSGSVRFWYNAWNDLPQVGGGSDQGILNPFVMPAQWEVLMGPSADLAIWWLQVLGADAVIVNGPNSTEKYHDFLYPEKFNGKLPVVYDDGAGNIIYQVPRRYKSLARVADRSTLDTLPSIPGNGDQPSLQSWFNALENGPDVLTATEWTSTDSLRVRAPVQFGQSVVVQVTYDPSWRAYVHGASVPIRPNGLGFMTVDAPPGTHEVLLEFATPSENKVGRALLLMSFLALGGLVYLGRR
jgi:hypothetical protein